MESKTTKNNALNHPYFNVLGKGGESKQTFVCIRFVLYSSLKGFINDFLFLLMLSNIFP